MIRLDYVGFFCNELYLNKFSVFFELFALYPEQLAKRKLLNYVQVEKQLIQ